MRSLRNNIMPKRNNCAAFLRPKVAFFGVLYSMRDNFHDFRLLFWSKLYFFVTNQLISAKNLNSQSAYPGMKIDILQKRLWILNKRIKSLKISSFQNYCAKFFEILKRNAQYLRIYCTKLRFFAHCVLA